MLLGQHPEFKNLMQNPNPNENSSNFQTTQFILPYMRQDVDAVRIFPVQIAPVDRGEGWFCRVFVRRRLPSPQEQLKTFIPGLILPFKLGVDYFYNAAEKYFYQRCWASNFDPKTSFGVIAFIRGENPENIIEVSGQVFLLNTIFQVLKVGPKSILIQAAQYNLGHKKEDFLAKSEPEHEPEPEPESEPEPEPEPARVKKKKKK